MRKTILIGGFAAIGGFVFAQQPPNKLREERNKLKQIFYHFLPKA